MTRNEEDVGDRPSGDDNGRRRAVYREEVKSNISGPLRIGG